MLTMKTLRGAAWLVCSRLLGRIIDLTTLLVLARLLSPADFGLVAIAMTLISVVDIVLEVPLTQALTRLSHIRKSHLDTAFTLGILRSFLLASIILGAAWPFSRFYDDSRLTFLLAALAIGPVSRGLYSPSMVMYVRDISFKRVFIAEGIGKVCGAALALIIMYLGGGYWAIAVNGVAAAFVMMVVSYVLAPYRPALSLKEFPEFSKFMGWFSVAQLVAALNWQFDRVLLGHFVNKSSFGRYTMASDLAGLPGQSLITPAMTSVLAALSAVNGDQERLRGAYLKASRFTMLLAAPLCVGTSLTSDLIVNLFLGAKWAESAEYLRWLALAVALTFYVQPFYNLALAVSRTDTVFRFNITELFIRLILVPLGLYLGSIMGVIAARGAISAIMFIVTVLTVRGLIGISVGSQLRSLREVAVGCAVMAFTVSTLRSYFDDLGPHPYWELVVMSGIGALVYGAVLHVLGVRIIQFSGGAARIRVPGLT
jgi:PST family polysaccharide transporter